MSKISKLFNKPDLFIKDFLKNKGIEPDILGSKFNISFLKQQKQFISKDGVNLIVSNIRLFKKTVHLLHTGEGLTHGPSHLDLWVEHFAKSGEDFAILIRNKALFDWAIQKYSYLDIVYAKNPSDVENILNKLPFIKAIYYFSNTGNLIHTLRYNRYKHIFLGHGDSEKAGSAHKFFRVYDEIWVAGQAHIDRFKNTDFNTDHIKFVKIGRPNLKNTLVSEYTLSKNIRKRLVYLPTWEGVYEENNYSSAHLAPVMLSEIFNKLNYDIDIKLHPVLGSRDKTLLNLPLTISEIFFKNQDNVTLHSKEVPVEKIIKNADFFICDISAVVSECISTLAPIFLFMPIDREIITSNSNMQYSEYTYVFSNIEELLDLLDEVIVKGNDRLVKARYKALDYLLTIDATKNDEFYHCLSEISKDSTLLNNSREKVIQ
ncbi:hypothetical protein [Acinetobacter sp.]|uniref:hypothetical protein n=1 Tax=Acinetobacter sp. TaxID=472 RepID=UPI0038905FD2